MVLLFRNRIDSSISFTKTLDLAKAFGLIEAEHRPVLSKMMILEVAVGALALAGVALGSQVVLNKPSVPQMTIATAVVENDDFGNRPGPGGQHLPTLADLLTLENSASIFFSYARETAETSQVLTQPNEPGLTVLVPTNKAIMALSHKP